MRSKKTALVLLYFFSLIFLIHQFLPDIINILKNINQKIHLVFIVFLLTLLSFWQQSNNYCIINKIEKNKHFAIFMIWVTSSLINYFLPFQSGTIARSLLMRKIGIPIIESGKQSARFILSNFTNAVILLLIFSILHQNGINIKDTKLLIIFASTIILLFIIKEIKFKYNNLFSAYFGIFNQIVISSMAYYTAFIFILNQTSIQKSILLTCSSIISSLISITPNGLGITEAFAIFTNEILALDLTNIIPALIFLRICHIITAIPICIIFIVFYSKINS
jgi:hypothetical protein